MALPPKGKAEQQMVLSGTLTPKGKAELLHPPPVESQAGSTAKSGGTISALQGRIGVPAPPRTQFSSTNRAGIFALSAPSHEAHGDKAQLPSIHRRPLSERSEEQKQEVHNLTLRLSGNPFPHDRPDSENNGLRLAEDRGRLVVRETTQFVAPEERRWHWKDQESKRDHSDRRIVGRFATQEDRDRRMLWAEGSEKESRACGIEPMAISIWSLPADHVEWQTVSRDTSLLEHREELSLRLAAERRSQRAVQRKPLGVCATGRRFNRTEKREEFWTEGDHRRDGAQPEWRFPHGYDSSRGPRKLDSAEKQRAGDLLIEDLTRAKYGTDVGRIAQASLIVGGHAHTGL